jgi:hypothetical protein
MNRIICIDTGNTRVFKAKGEVSGVKYVCEFSRKSDIYKIFIGSAVIVYDGIDNHAWFEGELRVIPQEYLSKVSYMVNKVIRSLE